MTRPARPETGGAPRAAADAGRPARARTDVDMLLGDRYRLLRVAGAGGMATIYQAWDQRLERTVAVKVLHAHLTHDPVLVRRFRTEARHVAALSHPHIVQVYDQAIDPFVFMVMEYVDGPSLRSVLGRCGVLTPAQVLAVLAPVAAGLAHAHGSGIVHRDVKPENVLIARDGTPKVADFGIARALAATAQTLGGGLVGSVHYLSPEQVGGDGATPASDQYALGVMCYELLTGRHPLPAETPMAVALRHARESVPPPSAQVPAAAPLDALVARATARDPGSRFDSLDAFTLALSAAVPGGAQDVPVPPDEGAPRQPTLVIPATLTTAGSRRAPPRRDRRITMAVVLALALVAAYAWWNLAWMPWHTVPDVTGAGERSALDELTVAGYDGQVTARRYDAETPTGRVLTQVPAPGSAHRARSRVGVVVSRGPAPVTVPDVRGRPGRSADRELERLGFDVRSTRSFSDDVPEGAVIAQLPDAGRAVAHGSRIELDLSRGPRETTAPDLEGLALDEARQQAHAAGVDLDVDARPVPRFGPFELAEVGVVERQRPRAGEPVRRDDAITVVVFE